MGTDSSSEPPAPLRRGADWMASREGLPLSFRAVVGYYADTGTFDYRSMRIKSHVDRTMAAIIDAAFSAIEANLERELDRSGLEFEYETKLTLPAELTLGYLYRRVLQAAPADYNPITGRARTGRLGALRLPFRTNRGRETNDRSTSERRALDDRVEGIDRTTRLVVEALIDGDMRDALNDEEYADFSVGFDARDDALGRRVAEIAQRTLEGSISDQLVEFPDAVAEAYHSAVAISERHQERDEWFRELLDDGPERVESAYKFADVDPSMELYTDRILDLPYFRTQYDRVGVIYDGMIDMYRGAGHSINTAFKRSIVLAIIGAQIWLDDMNDYEEDLAAGQLTPVTAEYELAATEAEAHRNVVDIAETYFDHAKRYAAESGTPMTGIAIEYIYRKGEPDQLPR